MNDSPKFSAKPDYEVGYGKPPATSRFQKGKSGNPKGRPKGSKNKLPKSDMRLRDILINEANREIVVQDKYGPISMPVAQAAARSLAFKAAQGNVSAQKLFLKEFNAAESEKAFEKQATFETAVEYKESAKAEIKRAKENGEDIEDTFLPHPDHIITDARTGEVKFTGPLDDEDKKLWDEYWDKKQAWEKEIEICQKELEQDCDYKKFNEEYLIHAEYMLSMIEVTIIMRWNQDPKNVVKDLFRRIKIEKLIRNGELPERPKYKK